MERGEPIPNQVDSVNDGKSRHRRYRSVIVLQQKLLPFYCVIAFEAWVDWRRPGLL